MEKNCDLRVKVSLDEQSLRYLLEDIEILKGKLDEVENRLIDMIKSVKIDIEQREC